MPARPRLNAGPGRTWAERSGLRVEHLNRLLDLRRAQGREGCREQERQAADHRIPKQRNPDRNRKRDGHRHRHQPDCRRHKNQTRDHVLQPPREEQDHVARMAWQDCGRVWVNLRSANRVTRRRKSAAGRAGRMQPKRSCRLEPCNLGLNARLAGEGSLHNPLKCIPDHGNCILTASTWARRDRQEPVMSSRRSCAGTDGGFPVRAANPVVARNAFLLSCRSSKVRRSQV